jgi:quercetin dioxygenase-like cupin family protein
MKLIKNFLWFSLLILGHPSFADTSAKGASPAVGTIPNISEHYQALPVLYHFEKMPVEKISDKVSRQYLYGAQSQIVKWYFKKGAEIPLHHHVNEQITWITSGEVLVYSQGKIFDVKAGDVIIIPPNVPHRFVALEDTIDVDFFTPSRQDWLDDKVTYYTSGPDKK